MTNYIKDIKVIFLQQFHPFCESQQNVEDQCGKLRSHVGMGFIRASHIMLNDTGTMARYT